MRTEPSPSNTPAIQASSTASSSTLAPPFCGRLARRKVIATRAPFVDRVRARLKVDRDVALERHVDVDRREVAGALMAQPVDARAAALTRGDVGHSRPVQCGARASST